MARPTRYGALCPCVLRFITAHRQLAHSRLPVSDQQSPRHVQRNQGTPLEVKIQSKRHQADKCLDGMFTIQLHSIQQLPWAVPPPPPLPLRPFSILLHPSLSYPFPRLFPFYPVSLPVPWNHLGFWWSAVSAPAGSWADSQCLKLSQQVSLLTGIARVQ